MSDDKNIRHRFTVPAEDNVVNTWIEKQSNLGFSIRVLIKAFVNSYGYQDATCLEFGMPVRRRGRPPKQAKIRYERMFEDNSEDEDEDEDDVAAFDSQQDFYESEQQPEQSVKKQVDKKIEKPVRQAKPITEPKQELSESDDSVLDLFEHKSTGQESSVKKQVSHDDDGFVDPESLF